MGKKEQFSVSFCKEYIVVAEDLDQAILKTQQYLNIPMEKFKEFKLETAKIDRDKSEKLYDGVDIE